ncbi:MAG: type II toxin-antitoxin system HicA family toxin [Thermoguttaceae bacterium]
MKLPRRVSGVDRANALGRLGYQISHQTGSHMRLTTQRGGEQYLPIPAHEALRAGPLSAILGDVAEDHQLSRQQLLGQLFR